MINSIYVVQNQALIGNTAPILCVNSAADLLACDILQADEIIYANIAPSYFKDATILESSQCTADCLDSHTQIVGDILACHGESENIAGLAEVLVMLRYIQQEAGHAAVCILVRQDQFHIVIMRQVAGECGEQIFAGRVFGQQGMREFAHGRVLQCDR